MEWLSTVSGAMTPTFWASMAGVALVAVFNAVNPNPAKGKGLHWVTKTALWIFGIVFVLCASAWVF